MAFGESRVILTLVGQSDIETDQVQEGRLQLCSEDTASSPPNQGSQSPAYPDLHRRDSLAERVCEFRSFRVGQVRPTRIGAVARPRVRTEGHPCLACCR